MLFRIIPNKDAIKHRKYYKKLIFIIEKGKLTPNDTIYTYSVTFYYHRLLHLHLLFNDEQPESTFYTFY